MSSDFTNHSENPEDLKQVEQTLAALSPRPPQVDRDRLMFLAGSLSPAVRGGDRRVGAAAKRTWTWPAATAALGATSLALAIALVVRTNPPPQIVYIDRPAPPVVQTADVPGPIQEPTVPAEQIAAAPAARAQRNELPQIPVNNYVRSRDVALRMGLDALGGPRSSGGGTKAALTYFDWLSGLDRGSPSPGASLDSELPKM